LPTLKLYNTPINTQHIGFAIFVVFLLIYYFAAFDGYYGYDDLTYARYAAQVANGTFASSADHFSFRWGIIYPTGWLYKCFGIGDYSTCLSTLLYTLLSLIGVYAAAKHLGQWVAVAAMALFSLDYYTLYFSHKLFADAAVTTFGFFALFFTATAQYQNNSGLKNVALGAAMAVCLWAGFVSKETIYFVVPFLVYVFGVAVWQKKDRVFWSSAITTALLLAILYAAYMQLYFGDIAYRFKTIEASSGSVGSCSYHLLPISHLINRLTIGLMQLWVATGMVVAMLFAPLSLGKNWRQTYQLKTPEAYYQMAFGVLFLSFYYLSISLKHYIPMCLDGRHYLMLIPFAAVASGRGLIKFCKTAYGWQYVVTALLGISIWAYLTHIGAMLYLYVLLLGWAVFRAMIHLVTKKSLTTESKVNTNAHLNEKIVDNWEQKSSNSPINDTILNKIPILNENLVKDEEYETKNWLLNENIVKVAFLGGFIAILLLHPLYVFMRPAYNGQHDAKKLVEQYLSKATPNARAIVITDGIQQNVSELYVGFDTTKIRFIEYRQAPNFTLHNTDSLYLLINRFSNNMAIDNSGAVLPDYAFHQSEQVNLVGKIGIAQLYRINKSYWQQQNLIIKQKIESIPKQKQLIDGVFY
jgi:hypothetical protein